MNAVKWIAASLMLMLVLGLSIPAVAQERDPLLNDSEEPGSVLVFHKFVRGYAETIGNVRVPRTEIEISVTCPKGQVCNEQWPPSPGRRVKLLAHWVCPADQTFENKFICKETNFNLFTTVNGTIRLDTEGNVFPTQATATNTGRIPTPPCERGYLIAWVVNEGDIPIKYDGLFGDAILRELGGASAYNALPIQAGPALAHLGSTDVNNNGALDFDGREYRYVTGKVFGTVRFDSLETPPFAMTALTLLTLDVRSNASNFPTFVNFDFYNEREELISTAWEFVCWTQVRLSDINDNLTETGMASRKGFFESGRAQQFAVPGIVGQAGYVTLLAIVETVEAGAGGNIREYAYSTYNDSVPVRTTFYPTFVPPVDLE